MADMTHYQFQQPVQWPVILLRSDIYFKGDAHPFQKSIAAKEITNRARASLTSSVKTIINAIAL